MSDERQSRLRSCMRAGCPSVFSSRGASVLCRKCSDIANDQIRELHAQGKTGPQIAALIGLSPNAVAVRRTFMKLPPHEKPPVAPGSLVTGQVKRKEHEGTIIGFTLPNIAHRLPAMPIPPARECQWIDGDPRAKPVSFCCKPVVARSLCAGHFAISYVPNRPRLAADAA